MFELPTKEFWANAQEIQQRLQHNYTGNPVFFDTRTGLKFEAQGKTCTVLDSFHDGIRFSVDGADDRTFYGPYSRLLEVGATYL